ncbi:tRNA lysidine(34) synthetase TilS [Convivina praedatoris]|nr:tRNA lysidine(34) synthetase TilS [Convivina sp. LMG 32447]
MSKIIESLKKYHWDTPVIIAVSGGLDSVVLLDALYQSHPQQAIVIAHVNYHLRAESDQDAAFVAQLAEKYHAQLVVKDFQNNNPSGIEGRARDFRYEFFEELAQQYHSQTVLVAHHADDQVETILLNLIRGGQLSQLTGMSAVRDKVLRPLLDYYRQDLFDYAQQQQLTWREDETNFDASYTARNAIRQNILPALSELNSGAKRHILDFAGQIANQEQLMNQQIQLFLPQLEEDWTKVPEDWLYPTLRYWLTEKGFYRLKNQQLMAIGRLLKNWQKPSGYIDLGEDWQFHKTYQKICLKKKAKKSKKAQENLSVMLKLNQWNFLTDKPLCWSNQQPKGYEHMIKLPSLPGVNHLFLRSFKSADRLAIKGGSKAVRRVLIDAKIPLENRHHALVLTASDNKILGVRLPNGKWQMSQDSSAQANQDSTWLVW